MDDSSQHEDSRTTKYSAPKDKNCPFCGQPFTSSSLGRHLDVYIKEKNPKPSDGVHDVDAIRKMRGNITRRQPRGSTGPRRGVSTPISTPKSSTASKDGASRDRASAVPPLPRDGQYAVDSSLSQYSSSYGTPRWDLNASANDLADAATPDIGRRPRNVSRQIINKAQFDAKHRLADAVDTARAAELALRELLGSWHAAKQRIDATSMPFDFDPLSLDFPALTLQCLQPPPTLFSSTQHPTSTSWSVQSPGQREFDALRAFFDDQFKSWKATCQSAADDVSDDSACASAANGITRDKRDQLRKAEKAADDLEKQIHEHLQSAYTVWDSLPPARQNEVWALEMARSVGRKHKEGLKMKETQRNLEQENAHLKAQIDQLNRRQQPREFRSLAPQTFPMDRDTIAHAYELGVKGASLSGLQTDDGQLDIGTLVSRSIERWKTVVSGIPDQRFMMQNGTGSPVGRTAMNMSRSMPHMNMAIQTNGMHAGDMGMAAIQGMRSDAMYME
ncbi:hypothetical protein GMORB2_0795 [Geosmithia morbida]|uniref:Uncharacterized protein n=1 Tax=Geosmithia morbida TaxID=1094350 RepID=A0A9P5D6F2_9HYPO|nr:uncharacterized protein GMORB2_0795 [Geosmithia morbida]KAF4125551.1 hypothetical protein GMORB2_0795 [Geosmithia morbida]